MRIRIESRDCVIDEGKEGYLDLPDNTAEALDKLAEIGRVRIVSAAQQVEWARNAHEAKMKRHEEILASYAKTNWGAPPAAPVAPDLTSFETYLCFETDYD